MTRFLLAAVLASAGTVAFTKSADAQYVYRYNTVDPWTGGVVQQGGYATPFGVQQASIYQNPWTGARVEQYGYQNPWGTQVYRSSGYSPLYGGFNRGSYYPGFGAS